MLVRWGGRWFGSGDGVQWIVTCVGPKLGMEIWERGTDQDSSTQMRHISQENGHSGSGGARKQKNRMQEEG